MMHPALADSLLQRFAKTNDIVFDPFCGSGTVLLASSMQGHHSIGYDINPLALLIAKAKTDSYEPCQLDREIEQFRKDVLRTRACDVPEIRNLDYWYPRSVIRELGRIRHTLLSREFKYDSFLTACFAYSCRRSSLTNHQEFKRIRDKTRSTKAPESAIKNLFDHITAIKPEFLKTESDRPCCSINLKNTETPTDRSLSYDMVLTSPPYGDHSTTVAYGQYSSFGNEWTYELNPFNTVNYQVDKEGLGRHKEVTLDVTDYTFLNKTIERISQIREDRARDVVNYFDGYYKALQNIVTQLAQGGILCFVVGNRTVAGTQIPLDQITAEMCESLGLVFVEIRSREISNKVMPLRNSPSNIAGRHSHTMTQEHVVTFQKV